MPSSPPSPAGQYVRLLDAHWLVEATRGRTWLIRLDHRTALTDRERVTRTLETHLASGEPVDAPDVWRGPTGGGFKIAAIQDTSEALRVKLRVANERPEKR